MNGFRIAGVLVLTCAIGVFAQDMPQPGPGAPSAESSSVEAGIVSSKSDSVGVPDPATSQPAASAIAPNPMATDSVVPSPAISSLPVVTDSVAPPLVPTPVPVAAAPKPVAPGSPGPAVQTSSSPAAKRMLNVAVLPFTGNSDVKPDELAAITSRFESELMSQGTFRVLERRNVDAILREQGFQQSGMCNTSDCQVEVGQMLGVERIITGEVTRMDKLWSLTLRMVDVGTGAVAASHVLDIKGKLETVLRGGCPEMAEIIAGKKQPTGTRTVLAEEKTGVSPWVWVASGTVLVGGGVAAALLLTQDNGSSSGSTPVPPRDINLTLETGR